MAKTRSESNAVGNSKYTDLNMTFYPTQIDSKLPGAGYNPNLKGFWSAGDKELPAGVLPDYNMAEHVNALADAVMALQRILGVNPHIDFKGGNTTGTVSTRIRAAEDKDAYYDKRYGGQSWTPALGQTILTHTHGGGVSEAPKINLVDEVSGKLAKVNIDLTQATGLTGADISMSPSVSTKIVDAINDKLSTSEGGTVRKDLIVQGKFSNRTYREWTADDANGGIPMTDVNTLTNKSRRYSGTTQQAIIYGDLSGLLAGKYVVGYRVKVDRILTTDMTWVQVGHRRSASGQFTYQPAKGFNGSYFDAVNKYQMFYYVFDHEPLDDVGFAELRIFKDDATTSFNLDFDCAWVMPVHPAVFDK